jgi:hypothetical protein
MPSPMYPTTFPAFLSAIIILSFWLGSISANISASETRFNRASSPILRSSCPVMTVLLDKPIFLLRVDATSLLSPVITLSETPNLFRLSTVSIAESSSF